jgi:hypothetical protein
VCVAPKTLLLNRRKEWRHVRAGVGFRQLSRGQCGPLLSIASATRADWSTQEIDLASASKLALVPSAAWSRLESHRCQPQRPLGPYKHPAWVLRPIRAFDALQVARSGRRVRPSVPARCDWRPRFSNCPRSYDGFFSSTIEFHSRVSSWRRKRVKSTTTEAKALDPRTDIPSPWEAFYEFSRLIWLGSVATFGAGPQHKSRPRVSPLSSTASATIRQTACRSFPKAHKAGGGGVASVLN